MLGYVVLFVLTALIFLFVLQPLIVKRRQPVVTAPARLADLRARRAYLLDAIRDVDFDYSLGKVSQAEYDEARGRYLREAAEVLREIERETREVDTQIEREIAQLRERARGPVQPPGEAPPAT